MHLRQFYKWLNSHCVLTTLSVIQCNTVTVYGLLCSVFQAATDKRAEDFSIIGCQLCLIWLIISHEHALSIHLKHASFNSFKFVVLLHAIKNV